MHARNRLTTLRWLILVNLTFTFSAGNATLQAQDGRTETPPAADAAQAAPSEPAQTSEPAAPDTHASERLAMAYARRAGQVARLDPTTTRSLSVTLLLARLASDLDPDNLQLKRLLLAAAEINETSEAASIASAAVTAISRLDPHNDVIRLARLREALEKYQTAEERIQRLERFLSENTIDRLGDAVASRLALDLALLYRRIGNSRKYADWLGRATALDQSNKTAAGMAAGFFRLQMDDPFALGELMVNHLMADPRDRDTLVSLGNHLMQHHAYSGAARFYRLAVEAYDVNRELPAHELIADLAIAQWGNGQIDLAKNTIRARQRLLDQAAQYRASQENPDLSPMQREQFRGALPPSVVIVKLAILDHYGNVEEQEAALEQAIKTFEGMRDQLLARGEQDELDPEELRRLEVSNLLQQAWLVVSFGRDPERAQRLIDEAAAITPLEGQTRIRFDGWLALRRGNAAQAKSILTRTAQEDPTSLVGLALAHLELGETAAGARLLLQLSRERAGTVIGVWAENVLTGVLEQDVPLTPLAGDLNALAGSVPYAVDQVMSDPSQLVSMRVEPVQTNYDAYEPIMIEIRLANRASFPIEIGLSSPFQPKVAIEVRMTLVDPRANDAPMPLIVDVGRRLRLEPYQELVHRFDLRLHPFVDIIERNALNGANVRLIATSNHEAGVGGAGNRYILPGIGGQVTRSGRFNVNGARVNIEWIDAGLEAIKTLDSPEDLAKLALFLQLVPLQAGDETAPAAQRLQRVREASLQAFTQATPQEQAWLLTVMPVGPDAMEPYRQVARRSTDADVRIMYLLNHVARKDDPVLVAARESDDPNVQAIGEWVHISLLRLEAEAQRRREQQLQEELQGQQRN